MFSTWSIGTSVNGVSGGPAGAAGGAIGIPDAGAAGSGSFFLKMSSIAIFLFAFVLIVFKVYVGLS